VEGGQRLAVSTAFGRKQTIRFVTLDGKSGRSIGPVPLADTRRPRRISPKQSPAGVSKETGTQAKTNAEVSSPSEDAPFSASTDLSDSDTWSDAAICPARDAPAWRCWPVWVLAGPVPRSGMLALVSKGIGDRDSKREIFRRTVQADTDRRFKIQSLREPTRQSKRQAIGVLAAQISDSEAGTPGKRARH